MAAGATAVLCCRQSWPRQPNRPAAQTSRRPATARYSEIEQPRRSRGAQVGQRPLRRPCRERARQPVPPCEKSRHLDLSVSVANAGPDAASNVFVDLGQTPVIAPGLRFTNTGCTGTRCTIASIPAGSTVTLLALSSDFANSTSQTLVLNFAASSSDTDYATANNQATSSESSRSSILRHRHRSSQRGRSSVLHRDRRLRLPARTARPGTA